MVILTINYGYDIHSIEMDEDSYTAVKNGDKVELDGQGFVHEQDGAVADHWVFNRKAGEIYFWLDNGAEFYAQESWIVCQIHRDAALSRPD